MPGPDVVAEFLGTSIGVFLGLTSVIFGAAAALTGQALAATWRPVWQNFVYGFLLAGADRFLVYALFEGELLSPGGFASEILVLVVFCLVAYRLTRARKMVSQYPWLYERAGLFGWRPKS